MRYYEFRNLTEDSEAGYYDPKEDNYDRMSIDKPRQQKLTLKMLNRLKRIRNSKKLENDMKAEFLGIMYAQPTEEEGP